MATEQAKEAARQRSAAWRRANPERTKALSESSRKQRKENWDAFLASERERYQRNRDVILERQRCRREADGDNVREIQRRAYRKAPHKAVANCAARKAASLKATPAWADLKAIKAVYAEARRLTLETGIPHEVDHFYPLRGRTVSGLHVIENLRIVTRRENRSKGYECPS